MTWSIAVLSLLHWSGENVVTGMEYVMRESILLVSMLVASLIDSRADSNLDANWRLCCSRNSCSAVMLPSTAYLHPNPLFGVELDIFLIFVLHPKASCSQMSFYGCFFTVGGKELSSKASICHPLLWKAMAPPVALMRSAHSCAPSCR
jgi:hypothetical protein